MTRSDDDDLVPFRILEHGVRVASHQDYVPRGTRAGFNPASLLSPQPCTHHSKGSSYSDQYAAERQHFARLDGADTEKNYGDAYQKSIQSEQDAGDPSRAWDTACHLGYRF